MSKNYDHPWSVEEIIDNASNWSLAGDAGLLKHLEAFSEDLFKKANETNDNLNNLLDNLNSTSIQLELVKNEFLGLQNTQFIESRVYEDDETLGGAKESNDDKKASNEDHKNALKHAVLEGLEIFDKYYDRVSLPASDSEDDGECISHVLRPRDPYLSRPLPYVIGSEDWYRKWHIGLEDSSSDSEAARPEEEKFSDSDSESNLPVTDRRGVSTSDSGTDLSTNRNSNRPIASSTFNDTRVESSDSEEYNNSLPVTAPISNATFAEQLSAKLGNVVVQSRQEEEPVINNRPLQKPQTYTRNVGDLFANEPPPLEDSDGDLYGNTSGRGKFSGDGGLFDESEDEGNSFWGQKQPPKSKVITTEAKTTGKPKPSGLFDDDEDDIFKTDNTQGLSKTTRGGGGLFDGTESDEDDMFSTVPKDTSRQKSILKPMASEPPPFVNDEPPDIVTEKKKPTGGISVFGGAHPDLGAIVRKRRSSSSDESGAETTGATHARDVAQSTAHAPDAEQPTAHAPKQHTPQKPKKISLFDVPDFQDDDLFAGGSDLFGESGLFGTQKKLDTKEKLTGEKALDTKKQTKNKLFDSNEDLFDYKSVPTDVTTKKSKGLFDDDSDDDFLAQPSLFSDSKKRGLFDGDIRENGNGIDITQAENVKNVPSEVVNDDVSKLSSSKPDVVKPPAFKLFDDSPPDLDDWDTKSDNFDDDEDIFDVPTNNIAPSSSNVIGLFDDTPPPLENESHQNTNNTSSRLFDDSPPPIDQSHRKPNVHGLFDDGPPPIDESHRKPPTVHGLFDDSPPPIDESHRKPTSVPGLFDDSPPPIESTRKPPMPSENKSNRTLFDDTPPPLDDSDGAIKSRIVPNDLFVDLGDDLFGDTGLTKGPSAAPIDGAGHAKPDVKNRMDFKVKSDKPEIKPRSNLREVEPEVNSSNVVREVVSESGDGKLDDRDVTAFAKAEIGDGSVVIPAQKISGVKSAPAVSHRLPSDAQKAGDEPGNSFERGGKPEEVEGHSRTPPKKESPGKLKHNLTINVAALLPGAAHARKKQSDVIAERSPSPDEPTKSGIQTEVAEFQGEGSVETLHSVIKSRARIQVKRKPSTRRGRQESLKKKNNDNFTSDDVDDDLDDKRSRLSDQNQKPGGGSLQNDNQRGGRVVGNDLFDEDLTKQTAGLFNEENSIVHDKPEKISTLFSERVEETSNIFDEEKSDKILSYEEVKSKIDLFDEDTPKNSKKVLNVETSNKTKNIFSEKSKNLDSNHKSDQTNYLFDDQPPSNIFGEGNSNIRSFESSINPLDEEKSKTVLDVEKANKSKKVYKEEKPKSAGTSKIDDQHSRVDQNRFISTSDIRRGSVFDDDDDLFGSRRYPDDISRTTVSGSGSLFDDLEGNDDLFGEPKKPEPKKNKFERVRTKHLENITSKDEDESEKIEIDTKRIEQEMGRSDIETERSEVETKRSEVEEQPEKSEDTKRSETKRSERVKPTKSIFGDDDDTGSDTDMFASKHTTSTSAKNSIFGNDDDDDFFKARSKKDLFGGAGAKKKVVGKRGNLFDDVDEDDDIFGSAKNITKSLKVSKPIEKRQVKIKPVMRRPQEAEAVHDDPLDALK